MKRFTKAIALVVAALLALPLLGINLVFAEEANEATTYSFVVDNTADGYHYTLYQMFSGDVVTNDDGDFVISNVKWGESVPSETQEAMYDMFKLEGEDRNAVRVAEEISASTDSDLFHTMMTYMSELGKTNGASLRQYATLTKGTYDVNGEQKEGYGIDGLPAGYYLVRNTGVPANDPNAAYSDYIIEVTGEDIFAETKEATTTAFKKVQDVNDVDGEHTDLQDSADYDIGDSIPYTLTATLPMNYSMYDAVGFNLKFEDDMDKGLTWDGTATIYYGDVDNSENIKFEEVSGLTIEHDGITEEIQSTYDDGSIWMYDCGNLKEKGYDLQAGDRVWVEYKATLNTHAIVGPTGNENKHRIIFSHNPTDYSQLNASEFDKNVVYTYKTVFHKVDEKTGAPLPGADFTLEKLVDGAWVDVTALNKGDGAMNPIKTVTEDTTFTFTGLDDGTYRITESKTPDGYNTMEPQEFDIVATHTDGDDPELESLEGTSTDAFTMEANMSTATLSATITNREGVVLPSSGDAGTRMIYIIGSALVVASIAILYTRRQSRAA